MNKAECLNKSKMFLKMAKCDFAVIGLIKILKAVFTAMLFLNSAVFLVLLICGAKKK